MPGRPPHPQPLQPSPQLPPRHRAGVRQPVTQGPVRIPDLERRDGLRVRQLPAFQERHRILRLRGVQQGLLVEPTTCPSSSASSASRRASGSSFAAVDRRTGPPPSRNGEAAARTRSAAASVRSNSTACRKLTPWARITQSTTLPQAWQAPRQCHKFFPGETTSDGPASSWNGHRPTRSAPCGRNSTPTPSTQCQGDERFGLCGRLPVSVTLSDGHLGLGGLVVVTVWWRSAWCAADGRRLPVQDPVSKADLRPWSLRRVFLPCLVRPCDPRGAVPRSR